MPHVTPGMCRIADVTGRRRMTSQKGRSKQETSQESSKRRLIPHMTQLTWLISVGLASD